jgi:hypothetical protein
MLATWVAWVGFALVALSVLVEAVTGVARVRGVGRFARAERPRAYWLALLGKALLAAGLATLAVCRP